MKIEEIDEPCPKCGCNLCEIILHHPEHDEMFGANDIKITCPKCGAKLKVYMDLSYIIDIIKGGEK